MKPRVSDIPIEKVYAWRENNPRDIDYYDPALIASLAAKGQISPAVVMRGDPTRDVDPFRPDSGKQNPDLYYTVQGTRRAFCLQHMAENNIDGPRTLHAEVWENLTDEQIVNMTNDHGHKGLSRAEVFLAIERMLRAAKTEKQIANELRPQIDAAWKPDAAKDLSTEEKYFKYRKGTIQAFKDAALAPVVLRDAYYQKLKRETVSPRQDEMRQMSQVHQKELAKDRTNTINRQNPGPEFLAAWQKYLDAIAAAAKTDQPAKSTAMMNREAIITAKKSVDSRLLKMTIDCVLKQNGYSDTDLLALDKVAVLFENGNTAEAVASLDKVSNAKISLAA